MRFTHGIVTAVLLFLLRAVAQQPAQAPPPAASDISQPTHPAAEDPAFKARQQVESRQPSAVPPNLPPAPATIDQVVDRLVERERNLMKMLEDRTPIVETYLQNVTFDAQLGPVPKDDRYFLGRMDFSESIDRKDYMKQPSMEKRLLGGFTKFFNVQYQPLGFSWMIFADRDDFDREHYDFRYDHREFLGEVRCLVFDVTPRKDAGKGRFLGRIWVEDRDFNIVRLNGTYAPRPRNGYFFHMDSWRLNLVPGYWVPAYIYSEEGDFRSGAKNNIAFKAQSRLWGYNVKSGKEDELTQVRVDSTVKDESPAAQDASPLQAERQWQQQAADNVLERLQRAGLAAPKGDVDNVLQTVVNNLQVTNNLVLPTPVRTRVLLTTPLETFSVGNTIVISRGLIDVLPDETSLAAILAHELAHIVLGHNTYSQYAFNDRMLFSDESTYSNLGFKHSAAEETEADTKAIELLKNSPYGQKLENAGLFLKALQSSAPHLPALLTAHLGNNLSDKSRITRLPELINSAPTLEVNKLDQVAALPLGGRVKMNGWDDRVELIKSQPVALTSSRDKKPFEVTPFFPRLTRIDSGDKDSTIGQR
jgi:Peptidase family M48